MTFPAFQSEPQASLLHVALQRPRLEGLDSIRALAVLSVILDHLGWANVGPVGIFNGGLGVEVFFVLSGFLITWLLLQEHERQGHIDWRAFFVRRVARLLPALLLYIGVGAALLSWRGKPIPWDAVAAAGLYVINYTQALTGAPAHYLSHCWSLAVEEQFYLLWPLLLGFWLKKRWPLGPSLAWSLVSLWLLKVVWLWGLGQDDAYMYRALETRVDQLAVGCTLAVLLRSARWCSLWDALAGHRWVLWAGLGLLLVSSNVLHSTVPQRYLLGFTLEPLLIAVLLPLWLIEARIPSRRARWLIQSPLLVFWGQISYGMYLFHPFVVHPVYHAVLRHTGVAVLGVMSAVAVLTVVAYASFRWVERPLRERVIARWAHPGLPSKVGAVAQPGLSATVVAAHAALGVTPARSGE